MAKRAALIFTVIVYISGLIGMHTSWREWFVSMTPFSLLVSVFVLIQHQPLHTVRTFSWMVGAFMIGYFSEVLGVNTGLLFGDYAYGQALGPKLAVSKPSRSYQVMPLRYKAALPVTSYVEVLAMIAWKDLAVPIPSLVATARIVLFFATFLTSTQVTAKML